MKKFGSRYRTVIITSLSVFLIMTVGWHVLSWRAATQANSNQVTQTTIRRLRLHAFELERLTTAVSSTAQQAGDKQRSIDLLVDRIKKTAKDTPTYQAETDLPSLSQNSKLQLHELYQKHLELAKQIQDMAFPSGDNALTDSLHELIQSYADLEAKIP